MRIAIPSMHCDGCVRSVTRAVRRLDPAAHVAVDLGRNVAEIETRAGESDVLAALAAAGFEGAPVRLA